MSTGTITIVGCGYVGRRLAKRCLREHRDVLGTVRSETARRVLEAERIPVEVLDMDRPMSPWSDSSGSFVYMVPPPSSGDTDPRIGAWLESLTAVPRCIVYLSTTAVYGDRGGGTVDERTTPRPSGDRGRRRLDAERRLASFGSSSGAPVRILRVPGIYGPGRLPLARIAEGHPIPAPSETGPGNRIHVDDLVAACLAALDYSGEQQIFNVGDGEYASMGEYFLRVASIAGLEPPPRLTLAQLLETASPAMRGFLMESRRVDVTLMKKELGLVPQFSDLDEGIRASLAEEGIG